MEDKIQAYRQPMVTATGIMLGFVLNFAAGWVKTETQMPDSWAYGVGMCILSGIVALIITLYRILKMDYPRETANLYYQKTLRIFIVGVSMAFIGALMDMFSHFMVD